MASALAGPLFDVHPGQPDHVAGPAILQALSSKGFAIIGQDTGSSFASGVLGDIKAIDTANQLQAPPRLVSEGLLGEKGAARICELSSPEVDPEEWEGSSIRFADSLVSQMGELLEPLAPDLGFTLIGRTPGVLIETGDPSDDPPDMDNVVASKWLSILANAKLLVLHFLGPSWGTLELRVVGEDDMEPYFVQTGPGMMVVLRADILMHEHTSAQPSYVVSSFACGERLHWYKKPTGDDLHPAAQAIDQWIVSRMVHLKRQVDNEDETAMDPSSIPRSMQRTMNRMFVKGERSAILGTSCKFSNLPDLDSFHSVTNAAFDAAEEVPYGRWDHTEHYHPDLEGYHYGKVYCMHMTFCPNLEMFDNKFFLISPAEASKMDPCERQILEVGYEACARGGLRKKDLMGSDCGVYVAWQSEQAVGSEDRGMGANRFSFCLGCKGPSLACDVDHASAMLAMKVSSNELGRACNQGLVVGCSIMMAVTSWLVHCGAHLLSPAGRTCSFDANASGFIRGDSISGAYMRALKANDDDVWDSKVASDGVIVGTTCKNQGRTASLRSVSGPCLQECFHEGVQQGKISPLDVDIVECHAKGDVMQDGVEVAAILRAFRPVQQANTNEPVTLGASKSYVGNSILASGMATILKGLAAGLYGNISPVVHLNQINPLIHSEVFGQAVNIPCECLDLGTEVSYTSMMAYGWGGTNAQILAWNRVDLNRIFLGRPSVIEKPIFWPGGGGILDSREVPAKAYTIVGTWSSWTNPQAMEKEDEGVYGYTVTLGENCWEMFQIWLDGDEDRVLHPGRNRAGKAVAVSGPERVGVHLNWVIDGRAVLEAEGDGLEGYQDATPIEADPGALLMQPYAGTGGADGLVELPHSDRGWPGAEYRIRLRVAGKWRSVEWERISEMPAALDVGVVPETAKGKYFVAGSFNDWGFQEMSADFVAAGVYNIEVTLYRTREYFQIVRNEDWQQMIYPLYKVANQMSEVGGPDDGGHGSNWCIKGEVGDIFRIEFQRSTDESGFQSMKVSWRHVRNQSIDSKVLTEARRTKYFVVGSWSGYRSRREMVWNGTYFSYEVSVEGKENFQILMNGNWGAVLFPNNPNQNPMEDSGLCGPSESSYGREWTIGEDPKEDADGPESQTYELRLTITRSGMPIGLECLQI